MNHETEADFLNAIIDLAHHHGWICVHFRPGLTAKGWRTPVQGDGAGFPDLVLVRERVIFAEVKSATGELSWDQAEWLAMLEDAGAEVYAFRPEDWETICSILQS